MAINGKTQAAVSGLVTNVGTTETQFMEGMNDIIAQVDSDQINLAKTLTVRLTSGSTTNSDTFSLSDTDLTAAITVPIGADSVDTEAYQNNSIATDKIRDGAVTGDKTATLDAGKITTGTLPAAQLPTIPGSNIADSDIQHTKLAANSVRSDALADDAVNISHLNTDNNSTANYVLATDSTNNSLTWLDSGSFLSDSVVSRFDIVSTAGTTAYTIPNSGVINQSSLIYIDGVYMHEGQDYSTNAAGTVITLDTDVGAGRNIEIVSFANANALGDNEVQGSVLVDDSVTEDKILLGGTGHWSFNVDNSNNLNFQFNGTTVFRVASNGALDSNNDITAFSDDI